jgi:hypothetical protein
MFQTVHIFRKDAFHLWPEILIALVLFAGFAWAAPSNWVASPYQAPMMLLSVLLHALLPVSWLVLISRAVHDESLVGDRQFWTSRPYHWASLLAAKLLFLVVFIYLPFLIMQCFLLKHAGLFPTTVIPALLHNLLLLTIFFILPILALAAVTTTFPRLLLSVLAALVYLIAAGGVFGWYSWQRMPAPHIGVVTASIFIVVLAGTLIFQYALRRTLYARLALAALPLLIILTSLLLPTSALIRHRYPALSTADAPKLSPLPDVFNRHADTTQKLQIFRGNVSLALPMLVSGVDEKSGYAVEGYTVTVDAPGVHWVSPWQQAGQQIGPNTPATVVGPVMPLAVFEKLRHTPADVTLTLAVDHLKIGDPYTVKAARSGYAVPGHGLCGFDSPDSEGDPDTFQPTCRFPFQQPEHTFVSAPMAASSCSSPSTYPANAAFNPSGLALSFDPVSTGPLNLSTGDPNPQHRYVLCPDTTVTVQQAKSQGYGSLSFEQKGMILDNYAARLPRLDLHPHSAPAPASPDQQAPGQEPPVQQ